MDVTTRLQIRARAQSYAERNHSGISATNDDGSGNDSASDSIARRKFQRTFADQANTAPDPSTFRKPTLPASAARQTSGQVPNSTSATRSLHQRRRSTLRENTRVPSGPREYRSPRKSIDRAAPSDLTSSNFQSRSHHRSFLPQNTAKPTESSRFSFGNHSSNDTDSPTTPAEASSFDFLPTVNFDDFQTTLANYEGGSSPLLNGFPAPNESRTLPKDDKTSSSVDSVGKGGRGIIPKPNGHSTQQARRMQQRQDLDQQNLTKGENFRRRMSALSTESRQASQNSVATLGSLHQKPPPSAARASSGQLDTLGNSTASRRIANNPQIPGGSAGASNPGVSSGLPSRHPRKSVGPGLITTTYEASRRSGGAAATQDNALHQRSTHGRTPSTSQKPRRSTLQSSSSANAVDLPRVSNLNATTQSRQAKVKSYVETRKDDLDTAPQSTRPTSKGNLRAASPNSSGNKRQSIVSGRASGLGARTISPTDARRLKRMSMMSAVPMPSMPSNAKTVATPLDELPPSLQGARLPYSDSPRQTNPSPSFIPRKMSYTPTSTRASPDSGMRQAVNIGHRGSGVSLSSKSSYSSLLASSNSASRLPTLKTRNLHSAASASLASDGFGDEGTVPPVPRIPKAYESPKECDVPFFSDPKLQSSLLSGMQPRRGTSAFSGSSSKLQQTEDTSWTDPGSTFEIGDVDASVFPASLLGFDDGSGNWKGSPKGPKAARKQSSIDPSMRHRQSGSVHRRTATSGNANVTADDLTAAVNNANASAKSSEPFPDTSFTSRKHDYDPAGRKNANLQPLRLPPLNLRTNNLEHHRTPGPSGDPTAAMVDILNGQIHTPEPKRAPKTPSTPMTASKATFSKRSQTEQPAYARSSSSHFALSNALASTFGDDATKWIDESDPETGSHHSAGVSIPKQPQQHRGITPFSSGSLPKGSGEFVRNGLKDRAANEDSGDEYSLGQFNNLNFHNAKPIGYRPAQEPVPNSLSSSGSPVVSNGELGTRELKKESSSNGLRRKLSMSWRRSSSKATSHAENQDDGGSKTVREKKSKDAMPPPKMPASAVWNGVTPHLPSSTRRSLDQSNTSRRKSSASGLLSLGLLGSSDGQQQAAPQKTTRLHSEQPQPVSATNRSTSWGSFSLMNSRQAAVRPSKSRGHAPSPSISALTKDKEDMAADDEMRRLSQKRRDVDAAARESENIWQRAKSKTPMSPEKVLHDSNIGLNIYERGEIVDYQKEGVYFTGLRMAKKIIGSVSSPNLNSEKSGDRSNNFGYDDERGDYNIVLGDHLAYRYEVIDVLGKGSFGQVVRCVDYKEGGVVAIKIIRNKKRFHQQALVEVGILTKLREWDPHGDYATLSITSSFYFRGHLCIVTPCLGMNLYELIRAHNFTGFSIPLIRRFARQMLACLTLLQQRHIIHCDLKPENILICDARKADVRVIDFGSSCKEEEKVYTYIQSRFYRSPEVILGSNYGLGIDMWSFGCILAELWTGYPIFPGENEQEQLACIMEIFGPPDKKITDLCTRKKLFFDSLGKPRVTVSSKGRRRRPSSKTLQQSLKTDDEAFLDFIAKCLRWDPDRRLKPTEAVSHPFITNTSMKQQRQGIPDEARRAARLRSTAAVPTTAAAMNGGPNIASPVKRTQRAATDNGNAFAQQQQQQSTALLATPVKHQQQRRDPPETPQTVMRAVPAHDSTTSQQQPSPQKATVASTSRRISTLASTGGASAAMAGSKRASNGATLGNMLNVGGGIGGSNGVGLNPAKQSSGKTNLDLAQLAAAQSMSAGNAASSRWKS